MSGPTTSLESIQSFFDLSANDIYDNTVSFDKFRGHVTIVTNVASKCGKTATHYKSLVDLWGYVKDENINILTFPCNQFRKQEPGNAEQIIDFAKKKGVEFTMMSKIDVNGPDTDIVYQYLKSQTGIKSIKWNFSSYFIIGPDGSVTEHSGVQPMDLLDTARNLLTGTDTGSTTKKRTNDSNDDDDTAKKEETATKKKQPAKKTEKKTDPSETKTESATEDTRRRSKRVKKA